MDVGKARSGSWLKKIVANKPFGECFRNSLMWASDEWSNNNREIDVVHGFVTNIEGKRFWHSWCEEGDKVYDLTTLGSDKPIDKEKWYKLVNAEPKARYSTERALVNSIREGHFGPWDAD